MKVATSFSTHPDAATAVADAYARVLEQLSTEPQLLFLHSSITYDGAALMAALAERAPGIPIHGATSCVGAMTQLGFHCENDRGLGILGVLDPDGSYGVGAAELDGDPRAAARRAGELALQHAGRLGEVPNMVWIVSAPGSEEMVLQGLGDLFGPNVPIGGGSSADNAVRGDWQQFANGAVYRNAAVVTVLFASKGVGFSFHSGYDPGSEHATVTRGDGRTIHELDGRPAAEVYNAWTHGKVGDALPTGGNVLMQTSLSPLGRIAGRTGSIPYFQLSHPDSVTPDGSLTMFSNVSVGDVMYLMHGSPDTLVTRAERVARSAIRSVDSDSSRIAGALVIYCAGCMLMIKERISEVVANLRRGLGEDVPFLGAFTFGEQGCFLGGENRHGNLMISILVFLS